MRCLRMGMYAGDASKVLGGPSGDEEGGGRRQDLWHAHPRRHLPRVLPAGCACQLATAERVAAGALSPGR